MHPLRLHLINQKKLKKNQSGQAVVEYVLLLSFALIFALSMMGALNATLRTSMSSFLGILEDELRVGNVNDIGPANKIWREE